MSRAIYQNKLAKADYNHKMLSHHAQLQTILQKQFSSFANDNSAYKKILRVNPKGEQLKKQRNKEMMLENTILSGKINKIRKMEIKIGRQKNNRYSHSLNEIIRENSDKERIKQNRVYRERVKAQRSLIDFKKMQKLEEKREGWQRSISKMQKYKLPEEERQKLPTIKSSWVNSQTQMQKSEKIDLNLGLTRKENPENINIEQSDEMEGL